MTWLPDQILPPRGGAVYPGRIVLGDDLASPNTLPRGMLPLTGKGPLGLHPTNYLTFDTSLVTVHINSRLPPPTTAQRRITTSRHMP